MPSRNELIDQITDAYEHLYDLVYLRAHPLVASLVPDSALSRREGAWRLHHILLELINELAPGPQAPPTSVEWRRHRLAVLRYLEGLNPQAVADQLGISRRHYYREQKLAIEALADLVQDHYGEEAIVAPPGFAPGPQPAAPDHLELLRLEAARAAQANRLTQFGTELEGVISLLQEPLHLHDLAVEWPTLEPLPDISIDRNLLRQVLLGILGYLIERAAHAVIQVSAHPVTDAVRVAFRVVPTTAISSVAGDPVAGGLGALMELAALASLPVTTVDDGSIGIGVEADLPTASRRTILVVDDNEDVLELFERYLDTGRFQAVTARTAQEGLEKARRLQPYAITLDLMMPHQDGWDLLQILLNQPETQHIPIIVCSVLKQKELALALGATAFLEKPITEQRLLSALMHLET